LRPKAALAAMRDLAQRMHLTYWVTKRRPVMSATMQALIFEMLPIERRALRDQTRESAVTLVEHLPVEQEVDNGWELFEMRFQEHSARAAFNDVFAAVFLQTED
jgi:hypothetical protein